MKKGMKERRIRNRQMILKIIKKRAQEKRGELREEMPWTEASSALDYWKFLKDLEEGKIKRLNGKKIC